MDSATLKQALVGLSLGGLRYYERTGSTNDEATRWAEDGAHDLALVVADEQTRGRGRAGRVWFTPPGAALAFSLVLKGLPGAASPGTSALIPRLTALGSLAVAETLQQEYSLPAQIKWPNDVLLAGRKVAGVLVEAHWQGDRLAAAILGVGLNVSSPSVPAEAEVLFPATCVQAWLATPPSRPELLARILAHLLAWRPRLADQAFLQAWESRLAFYNEWVAVIQASETRQGRVLGLDQDGRLRLQDRSGKIFTIHAGEIRLRQLDFDQENDNAG
jgi:BirA family biotin operon repressor/biotin-[acetyl-CoA-carboxylase] ligase